METTSANYTDSKRKPFILKAIQTLRPGRRTIIEVISLTFVILFLYTGVSKLMEYSVFKEQLGESPVLKPIASIVAWAIPSIEFIVSTFLFLPKFRMKGLYAALGLMLAFTGYIIAILSFSDKIPCSCGGIIEKLSWQGHIIFNSCLIILSVFGIVLGRKL